MPGVTCHGCGTRLPGVRTVIGGFWHCDACTLELDMGRPFERIEPPKPKQRILHPQNERLFPLPPQTRQ
jgi:hypothetical protein